MGANASYHQYEPLRVPQNWGTEEKKLVLQLTDVLDDIFSWRNRLRFEDMHLSFRNRIIGTEGDVTALEITDGLIAAEVSSAQIYRAATEVLLLAALAAHDPVVDMAVGLLWYDTTNRLMKRCTVVSPLTWEVLSTDSLHTSFIDILENRIDIGSTGEINIGAGGAVNIEASGEINIEADGAVNVASGGTVSVASGGSVEIASGGDINVASGGNVNVAAGGKLNLVGADGIYIGTSPFSVGGTNLVPFSGTPYSGSYPYTPTRTTYAGKSCLAYQNTGANIIALNASTVPLVAGDVYAFSFWGACNAPTAFVGGLYLNANNVIASFSGQPISTAWVRYQGYGIFAGADQSIHPHLYPEINAGSLIFYIADWKLEKGNIATDWSPSPLDPATGVVTSHITIETDSLEIASGGSLTVTAPTTLAITAGATDATAIAIRNDTDYFLSAGDLTQADAPFWVKKDGSIRATKIQQEYSQSFWDLADASYPAEFPVYIPSGYTIDTVTFTFVTKKFRSFSKDSTSGNNGTVYTGDKTSFATQAASDSNTGTPSTDATGSGGTGSTGSAANHYHYVSAVGANTDGAGNHLHSGPSHTHTLSAHYHTHAHTHTIADHNHLISAHTHPVTMSYGIYEKSTLATSCDLKIGATTIGTYSPNPASPVEIKTYLSAGWNTVVVQPNNDARIAAYLLVKLTPS